MSRQIRPGLPYNSYEVFSKDTVEHSEKISQEQLNNAKIYSCREEYAKSLQQGIRYLEIGVAWGYSAKLFIDSSNAKSADLLDTYNQELKCWSWRKFGECKCDGFKHEMLYTPETHEQYIIDLFKDYQNVKTLKGDALNLLKEINNEYDYIYVDITNDRIVTRDILKMASKLVPVGGIIGMNDYLIFDGVIEEEPYGTYQTVNEFLNINKNWSVDAIALHQIGFYDIYLRKNS